MSWSPEPESHDQPHKELRQRLQIWEFPNIRDPNTDIISIRTAQTGSRICRNSHTAQEKTAATSGAKKQPLDLSHAKVSGQQYGRA